ncbi:MAG: DoxX family protein [Planctomycetaceae bacterium]
MSTGSMTTPADARPPVSKLALWSGRGISGLVVLAMLAGAGMNLSGNPEAAKNAAKLGYPEATLLGIGIAHLISTVLYAVPMTRVLGAILLTGYLGGAVATHIRAGEGWGTTVPAFVFGALVWLGLLLRDRRVRELLPVTKGV